MQPPPKKSNHALLSPAEACALAGVGPTTLKRWADAGVLAHVKTAGGHRRFLRTELERFLRSQTRVGSGSQDEPNSWIGKLLNGTPHEVEGELLFARARLGSWHAVATELGGVLHEIGERWRQDELSILDEHVASERLTRALARVGEALPSMSGAPRALLACPESEVHALGLALVELCLRELGWVTLWAGGRTPLSELERVVGEVELEMLALSASSFAADGAELERVASALETATARRGIALVLGGEGAWPEALHTARRFRDFESFHRFAAGIRRMIF